jgi:hypothetical protein
MKMLMMAMMMTMMMMMIVSCLQWTASAMPLPLNVTVLVRIHATPESKTVHDLFVCFLLLYLFFVCLVFFLINNPLLFECKNTHS